MSTFFYSAMKKPLRERELSSSSSPTKSPVNREPGRDFLRLVYNRGDGLV